MQAIAKKSERVIYQWTGFHAALRLSYRSLGDMRSDLCRLATTGLIWIPYSRCKKCAVGQMAGVSIKDLASEAKWLRVRLGACLR
jgi:hypothetical protein